MTGPIQILHVNVDQKAPAKFSRAEGKSGQTSGDCRAASPLAWNGETDLTLQAGESVCVEVGHATRVTWHARSLRAPAAPTPQVQASLP